MAKKLPKNQKRTARLVKMSDIEWKAVPVSKESTKAAFIRDAIAYALEYRDDFNQWRKSREKAE